MVSESQLEHLFERAHSNHFNEAEFYAHLLQAMVYLHVPVLHTASQLGTSAK